MADLVYKEEAYQIIGVCMEVHNLLGHGFLEIVYKDAIQYEFRNRNIAFEREKEFIIQYKEINLPHKFFADFVVFDKIILEVKCSSGIIDEHVSQTLNYLAASKCKLGLIVNFVKESLESKRIVL